MKKNRCVVGAKPLSAPMILNLIHRNKLPWNCNRHSYIFIQEIAFQIVVWEMAAVLFRPQMLRFSLPRLLTQGTSTSAACYRRSFPKYFDPLLWMIKASLVLGELIFPGTINHWPSCVKSCVKRPSVTIFHFKACGTRCLCSISRAFENQQLVWDISVCLQTTSQHRDSTPSCTKWFTSSRWQWGRSHFSTAWVKCCIWYHRPSEIIESIESVFWNKRCCS